MTTCVLLDSIYTTGWSDLCVAMMPLLVYLGASNTEIGLVTGAAFMGLPGIFLSPWISQRFHTKKVYLFVANIPYLLPIGLLGVLIFYSGALGVANGPLLWAVILAMVAHQFFAGFVALPHQEYIAACIPMNWRGRYNGLSSFFGSGLSIGSAIIAGMVLVRVEKPLSFGVLFFLTWVICQGGYVLALVAKESPVPKEKVPPAWSKALMRTVWNDKAFIRAILASFIAHSTFFAMCWFIPTYGFKELGMPAEASAALTIIGKVAGVLSAVPTGWIIDRIGGRRMIPFMGLGGAITFAAVLLIPGHWGVYIASGLTVVFVLGPQMGISALLYSLPKPEHRSGYYTLQLLVGYVQIGLGPILAGWMFDMVSFRTGFVIAGVIALLCYPLMRWLVKGCVAKG